MVHFVGAGPGAADLITVRGKALLEAADIIVYAGSLVNPQLLSYAKPGAGIYNSARMTLEAVISVLEEGAAAGLECVRLHTGDPSLYGAVREQMDMLEARGIAYDCCPGVSAAFGAAASLHLEYTLPQVSQTLIITRLEGRTPVPASESMRSLAAHGASMAIYLSAGHMEALQQALLEGGYGSDTPVALCYKATWPEERNFRCTLGELASLAAREGISKTALVLVGEVLRSLDAGMGEGHMSIEALAREKGYGRSCLYHPGFATEYREADHGN